MRTATGIDTSHAKRSTPRDQTTEPLHRQHGSSQHSEWFDGKLADKASTDPAFLCVGSSVKWEPESLPPGRRGPAGGSADQAPQQGKADASADCLEYGGTSSS